MSVAHDEPEIPAVCLQCRFAAGDRRECTLIMSSDIGRLLDDGPCHLTSWFQQRVESILRRRHRGSIGMSEDLSGEAQLRWLQNPESFPGAQLKVLTQLRRWLSRLVHNVVIDELRRTRVIARLRCGACGHFSFTEGLGCGLDFIGRNDEGVIVNPWAGTRTSRSTDPRGLKPPCEDFEWRRAETFDLFEHAGLLEAPNPHDIGGLVARALDRLAASSERGLRAASVIQQHYLKGSGVEDISARSGVSSKTVKRLLSAGRIGLATILKQDFGVDDIGSLL